MSGRLLSSETRERERESERERERERKKERERGGERREGHRERERQRETERENTRRLYCCLMKPIKLGRVSQWKALIKDATKEKSTGADIRDNGPALLASYHLTILQYPS